MKINLDEKEIYDLSELTSEELQEIFTWLKNNDEDWHILTFKNFKEGLDYARLAYVDNGWVWVYQGPTANAKELFYTLENIQVDCSELTEGQVKEMCKVYENNGYKQWIDEDALKIENGFTYLRTDWANEFYITGESGTKTTITYEKFMELFGENEKLPPYKEVPLKWNYETLVGDNQVVIEHTKEFIPSKKQVLKYLLKKDIILTPKQYKKLWKGL